MGISIQESKKAREAIAAALNASGLCGQKRTVEELTKKETWFLVSIRR